MNPYSNSQSRSVEGALDTAPPHAVAPERTTQYSPPGEGMIGTVSGWFHRLETNPLTEHAIMLLIIVNAIVLGLETSAMIMASFGPLLEALDKLILAIFVVEIAARIVVHRWSFFRDRWSVFDFVVVGIAMVPATNAFSVLRALRILRALRLITAIPTLKRVSAGLLASLPGMGSILFLIGLLYYVFGVLATTLFGQDHPNLFGSLPTALWTLFTVMTLEGWVNDVAIPVMQTHPYAWVFFIAFIVVTTFMVLNLFIGVVVNAMQEEAMKAEAAERDMIHEEATPILTAIKSLRAEVAELRAEIGSRQDSDRPDAGPNPG
jgi:voltage-gated sodium channel